MPRGPVQAIDDNLITTPSSCCLIFRATSSARSVSARCGRILRRSALVVAAGLLAGCGSTTKIQTQESVGQQLLDLERSHRDGVITDKEYERLKKAIIRAND